MSGGGISGMPQTNSTGWNRPTFTTNPNTMSPTQNWWLNSQEGQKAGGQEGLNQTLRDQIQGAMGNYGRMVDYANRTGISQTDIQNAIGGNTDMYTYMNRPNYQQYSPNGQFNPTIYQSNYQNYNTGSPMAISQYGQGPDYYGMGLAQQMNTPFNPYTNSYQQQTPFSYQQAQPNYGPSQPIVSRSAGMRGTPNVVRRAEGGIASLMDKE